MASTSKKQSGSRPSPKLAAVNSHHGGGKPHAGVSKVSDAQWTKLTEETLALSQDQLEVCMDMASTTMNLAQDMGEEVLEYANRSIADHVEFSKRLFACRTIADAYKLQGTLVRQNLETAFEEMTHMSERLFDYSSELLEPVDKCASQMAKRFTRLFS